MAVFFRVQPVSISSADICAHRTEIDPTRGNMKPGTDKLVTQIDKKTRPIHVYTATAFFQDATQRCRIGQIQHETECLAAGSVCAQAAYTLLATEFHNKP